MYEDFFIRINGDKDKYTVEAYGPGEISTGLVDLGFDSPEFFSSGAWSDLAELTDERGRQIGTALYQALFSPVVQDAFARSQQSLANDNKKLRLRLAIRPPALSEWPWELLYNNQEASFLSLHTQFSLVRFIDSNLPIASMTRPERLRILYVSALPRDLPRLDLEASRESLLRNLEQGFEVEVLEQATPARFRMALREGFHVLHFDGHASFDPSQGVGSLWLCDELQSAVELSGEELASYLGGGNVRLVVLNGCSTGRGSTSVPLAGIAHYIIRASSIPAVIAMQNDISDQLAIAFNEGLYRTLASQEPVDVAVLEGRRAIRDQMRKNAFGSQLAWAIPVLFMRSRDGMVFHSLDDRLQEIQAAIAQADQEGESATLGDLARGLDILLSTLKVKERSRRRTFGSVTERWGTPEIVFGRENDVRNLLDLLDPANPAQARRLIFLSSEEGAGVGEFLQASVMSRLIAGGEIALRFRVSDSDPGKMIRKAFLPHEERNRVSLLKKPLDQFLFLVSTLVPGRRIIIVLDDFDHFFATSNPQTRCAFLKEIKACLEMPSLPVHWILAVCEQNFTLEQVRELDTYVRDQKSEAHLARLNQQQARQLIEGLAWKHDLDMNEPRVKELLDRKDTKGYEPGRILAEFDEVERQGASKFGKLLCGLGIHNLVWDTETCDQSAYCTRCSKTKSRTRHSWNAPFKDAQDHCNLKQVCHRCGYTELKRREQHKLDAGEYTSQSMATCFLVYTCMTCGEQERSKTEEHQWAPPELESPHLCRLIRKCRRCGRLEPYGDIPHNWRYEWLDEGVRKRQIRTCQRCKLEETRQYLP